MLTASCGGVAAISGEWWAQLYARLWTKNGTRTTKIVRGEQNLPYATFVTLSCVVGKVRATDIRVLFHTGLTGWHMVFGLGSSLDLP